MDGPLAFSECYLFVDSQMPVAYTRYFLRIFYGWPHWFGMPVLVLAPSCLVASFILDLGLEINFFKGQRRLAVFFR